MAMSAAARLAQHLRDLTPAAMAEVSNRAGVPRRIGARARKGRKVGATEYMLLCSAVGISAATGAPIEGAARAGSSIVWWILGSGLFITRNIRRLDLRSAAVLAGVSAATLSRAEHGHPIAVESYLRVAGFMGVPPESFLSFTKNTNCNTLKLKDSAAARERTNRLVGEALR
jgi:hypothetical protein